MPAATYYAFFHVSSFFLSLWSRYSPQHVLSNTATSLLWNISFLERALVSTDWELRRHITLNFCTILITIYLLHISLLEVHLRLLFSDITRVNTSLILFHLVGWFPWRRSLRSVVEKNHNTKSFGMYKSLYVMWWCVFVALSLRVPLVIRMPLLSAHTKQMTNFMFGWPCIFYK
jgi:hypothetical protein